eukprot:CAMPEP_0115156330 /NCGR_PEP_ID=MMETSP0227-20121206/68376_1 /TAXON_ID=89957 /ORGANISM="Polarella glacialis, Strain CCMP 1383" /LENGTH=47 /DNA_ID= /DNA_START= /DNA_END= /DNA_ORIENTATION=
MAEIMAAPQALTRTPAPFAVGLVAGMQAAGGKGDGGDKRQRNRQPRP